VPVNWIRLPFIKWDSDKGADLEFTFQPSGARSIVAQVNFVSPGVPEPSGQLLVGIAAVCLLGYRRRR
jgi:hypothetical protein